MIGSPSESIENYKKKLQFQKSVNENESQDREIERRIMELLRVDSVFAYFTRMSWLRKLQFLNELGERIRSLQTMKILLNILFCTVGKIFSYCCTIPTTLIYNEVPIDHDRMLSKDLLENLIGSDLDWFANLGDKEQTMFTIVLLHYVGGVLARLFYKSLRKTYAQRLYALSQSPSTHSSEENPVVDVFSETKLDPQKPKDAKVIKLRKHWDKMITDYKKQIDKKRPKTTEKPKKNKKKKNKKKKGSKKSKKKKSQDDSDWLQFLPISVIKRIFSYLDKKSLNKAKKVSSYWKWVIGQLQKDKKVGKFLEKSNKLIKQNLGFDCGLLDNATLVKKNSKLTSSEMRWRQLRRRAAILEELRPVTTPSHEGSTILIKLFQNVVDGNCSNNLTSFSRNAPSRERPYQPQEYIVHDLNFIRKVNNDVVECLSDWDLPLTESLSDSVFD